MKKRTAIFLLLILTVVNCLVTVNPFVFGVHINPVALGFISFIATLAGFWSENDHGSFMDALLFSLFIFAYFVICILIAEHNVSILSDALRWFVSIMIGSFVTFWTLIGMASFKKDNQTEEQ